MAVRSLLCLNTQVIITIFIMLVLTADVAINSYAYWSMKNVSQSSLPTITTADPAQQFRRSSRILIFFLATALLAGLILLLLFYFMLCKLFKISTSHMTRQDQGNTRKQCCKTIALASTIALHIVLGALSLHYILDWEKDSSAQGAGADLRGTFRCLMAIIKFDLVISSIQIIVLSLLVAFMLFAQVIKHRIQRASRARAHTQSEHQDVEL
jgi:heme/copper-type cytochrome/quinol oxidase subunit 2